MDPLEAAYERSLLDSTLDGLSSSAMAAPPPRTTLAAIAPFAQVGNLLLEAACEALPTEANDGAKVAFLLGLGEREAEWREDLLVELFRRSGVLEKLARQLGGDRKSVV